LIDSATGCAGQTVLPAGVSYTTVETKANFSRPITKDQAGSAPKAASSAVAGASSPARGGSSTPAAASWRMGHRRSWCWQAKSRQLLLEVRTLW
jgi:hypothetical protein